jgi:hypothetical protein
MARRRRPEFYLLLGTVFLATLTAAILLARPLIDRQEKPKPRLDLSVADREGRLRVDWDASNPVIQSAQGGTLEVEDGGIFNRYPVEAKVLRSGGLDYVRRSDDVLLTLTLYQDGRPGLQTSIRRIPPISPPPATDATLGATERTRRR